MTALRDAAGAIQGGVVVIEDLTELIKAQQLAAWNEAARRIAHEIKNPLTPIRLSAERLLRKHQQGDPGLGRGDRGGGGDHRPRGGDAAGDGGRVLALRPHAPAAPGAGGPLAAGGRDGPPLPQPEGRGGGGGGRRRRADRGLDRRRADPARADQPAGQRRRGDRGPGPGHGSPRIRSTATWRSRWRTPAGASPPESKEKLFLPYYSTKGRGTGLGLAIVHRIVADHQGAIRVEDNVPQGTVFTVELPIG